MVDIKIYFFAVLYNQKQCFDRILCNESLHNGFLIFKAGFLVQVFNRYCRIAFQKHCNSSHCQLHLGVSVFPPLLQHWMFSHFSVFFKLYGKFNFLPTISSQAPCCIGLLNIPELGEISTVSNVPGGENSLCKGTRWVCGKQYVVHYGWSEGEGIWCKIRLERCVWARLCWTL